MESTHLRQFLESICCNSLWDYAVFWKLQHESQMVLILEDGYCHSSKPRKSMKSILDTICSIGSDEIFSSNCESKIYDGIIGKDPIELAVDYMSSVQYVLGDGVVGEVACNGNYRWFFCDDLAAGVYSLKSVKKYPEEWIFQFAAGIKTLLLIPVLPHGVLQLGSTERVTEDLALVTDVKDKIVAYEDFVGGSVSFSNNRHFSDHSSSSMMSNLLQNLNELSGLPMNELNFNDLLDVDSVKQTCHMWSATAQITSPSKAENSRIISEKDVHTIPIGATEKDIGVQLTAFMELPGGREPLYQSYDSNELEKMDSSMYRFSCTVEESQTLSHSKNDNMVVFGEDTIETMKCDSDRGMETRPFVDKDADNVSTFFNFPRDCELHKALGPAILGQNNECLWDLPISGEDEYSGSSLIHNGDFVFGAGPTERETNKSFVRGDEAEHLLGAGVDVYSNIGKNLSDRIFDVKSTTTTLEQFCAFSEGPTQSERCTLVVKDAVLQSCVTSAVADRGRNGNTSCSLSASSFESTTSALIGAEQHKKGYHPNHPRKGSKLYSDSKRKARTGDNKKPRPRDRQLIQDRLKELRELVPNGAKCSIDGLLDRTIQHMLFLRSATDQADRLRQLVHQKAAGGKNLKSGRQKGVEPNGTSWAFELGTEQQICPIIVEDLEFPGHMLIEILCNDHARFLEISDVIRRLELTILKGVMENHSESSWAQFVVEVPRGFHRLDIFWPLMQLLQ